MLATLLFLLFVLLEPHRLLLAPVDNITTAILDDVDNQYLVLDRLQNAVAALSDAITLEA